MTIPKIQEATKPMMRIGLDSAQSLQVSTKGGNGDPVLSGYLMFVFGLFTTYAAAFGLSAALWDFGVLHGICFLGFVVLWGRDEWRWSQANGAEECTERE